MNYLDPSAIRQYKKQYTDRGDNKTHNFVSDTQHYTTKRKEKQTSSLEKINIKLVIEQHG